MTAVIPKLVRDPTAGVGGIPGLRWPPLPAIAPWGGRVFALLTAPLRHERHCRWQARVEAARRMSLRPRRLRGLAFRVATSEEPGVRVYAALADAGRSVARHHDEAVWRLSMPAPGAHAGVGRCRIRRIRGRVLVVGRPGCHRRESSGRAATRRGLRGGEGGRRFRIEAALSQAGARSSRRAARRNAYLPPGCSSPIRGPGERGPFGAHVSWDIIVSVTASSDPSPATCGTIAVTGNPSPSTRRIRSRRNHFETRFGSVERMISSKCRSRTVLCTDSNGSIRRPGPRLDFRQSAQGVAGRS